MLLERGFRIQAAPLTSTISAMQTLALAAGEEVPWYHHSDVDDVFVCLNGMVVVEIEKSGQQTMLSTGEHVVVRKGLPHRVTGKNDASCRFVLIQGVGEHDYIIDDNPQK